MTWSVAAAVRRRLTGVMRGGVAAIARHSLVRGVSWAAAVVISEPRGADHEKDTNAT